LETLFYSSPYTTGITYSSSFFSPSAGVSTTLVSVSTTASFSSTAFFSSPSTAFSVSFFSTPATSPSFFSSATTYSASGVFS